MYHCTVNAKYSHGLCDVGVSFLRKTIEFLVSEPFFKVDIFDLCKARAGKKTEVSSITPEQFISV